MKLKILGTIVACLMATTCVAVPMSLSAGSTLTNPTGIDGLVVDGTTYDVTFGASPGFSPFAAFTVGGQDAATALASALNTLGVTGLDEVSALRYAVFVDWVPNQTIPGSIDGDLAYLNIPTPPWTATGGFEWADPGVCQQAGTCDQFTNWSVSAAAGVPEPASLSLLGLGLAGIGFMRRRKAA